GLDPLRPLLPKLVDLGRHAVDAVLLRNADPHSLDRFSDRRLVVWDRTVDRRRILGIVPRHRGEQDGAIAHRARERPRLIERGRIGHDAPARAAPIGRLDADDAGEGRRLADGAAGIRPRGAAAEAPEEPPGTSGVFAPFRRHGEIVGPNTEVSFDDPMANSSLLSLPSITAPSRQRLAPTVDS